MRCATRRMRSTVGCRIWKRAEWLCKVRQRVFMCATRVQCYTRIGPQEPILGPLSSTYAPSSQRKCSARQIFQSRIGGPDLLERQPPEGAPGPRPIYPARRKKMLSFFVGGPQRHGPRPPSFFWRSISPVSLGGGQGLGFTFISAVIAHSDRPKRRRYRASHSTQVHTLRT